MVLSSYSYMCFYILVGNKEQIVYKRKISEQRTSSSFTFLCAISLVEFGKGLGIGAAKNP